MEYYDLFGNPMSKFNYEQMIFARYISAVFIVFMISFAFFIKKFLHDKEDHQKEQEYPPLSSFLIKRKKPNHFGWLNSW